jgi:hypothetical protein
MQDAKSIKLNCGYLLIFQVTCEQFPVGQFVLDLVLKTDTMTPPLAACPSCHGFGQLHVHVLGRDAWLDILMRR